MTEIQTEPTKTEVKKPPKKRAKSRRKASARPPSTPKPASGEFAGITASTCGANCTAERCVITTVGLCGHPYKVNLPGAGPITKANIEKVRKLIKHQQIDMKG